MIRDCKRLVSAVLIFVLCISLGMTAYATETSQSGNKEAEKTEEKELTEEEKETIDFSRYGKRMAARCGAVETSYGYLLPKGE